MQTVSDRLHLERRNGVYYYRRRVPDFAVREIGKTTLKYSLRTRDKKVAKKRREAEDLKWSARFEAIEKSQAAEPHHVSLSEASAADLVLDYVLRLDQDARRRYESDPPTSRSEKREMEADAEIGLQMLVDPEDPRGAERISAVTGRLIADAGEAESADYDMFSEFVRRGLLELSRRQVARLRDDFSRPFFDSLFDPARSREVTFGELADQYLARVAEEAAINGFSQKRTDKVTANVALLRELVDDATPVSAIGYEVCQAVRSRLAHTPANRTKLYRELALDAAIDKAAKEGRPTLSATTQGQYLETFRNLLELAAMKGLVRHNPAKGLRPIKRDHTSPADRRRPFSLDQIYQFFNSEFYHRCAPHSLDPYKRSDRDWRFWLPLLCLFMGLRPNEACQMLVGDIRVTANGTWFVEITATSDEGDQPAPGKTVKTAASRRRVPLHPTLLKIGFLDLRKDKSVEARIFPMLKPDKYGNLATYALRRFRDSFFPEAITMEKRQTFYSLRHSFRDALRRINAPPETLQALGGWSQGTLTSDNYGDKSDPDYQVQFIDQVAFGELDLSFLWIDSSD